MNRCATLLLAATVAAASGCSTEPVAGCSGETCAGCCTETGECLAGDLPETCGAGGALCQACSAVELCQESRCIPGGTDAGPGADAGRSDAGSRPDAGSGKADAGQTDAGQGGGHDAGAVDAGSADAGSTTVGPTCSSGGFCWESSPRVYAPYAMHGAADGTAFTGAVYGAIQRFNGRFWVPYEAASVFATIRSVWAATATDAYAVSTDSNAGTQSILHYDGSSWSVDFTSPGLAAVWGTSASEVWAAADVNGQTAIFHRTGTGWSQTHTVAVYGPKALRGTAPNDLWLLSRCGNSPHHFDGTTWSPTALATGPLESGCYGELWSTGPNDAWAVRTGSTAGLGFIHWDGASWSHSDAGKPTGGWALPKNAGSDGAVWASGPSDVWAGIDQSDSLFHFNGASWSTVPIPAGLRVGAGISTTSPTCLLWGSGPSDIWTTTTFSSFLHFDGISWREQPSGYASLSAFSGTAPDDLWLVGDYSGSGATVLHRDANGWSRALSPPASSLSAVYALAPGEIYATGISGGVGHLKAGAWSWKSVGSTAWYGVWAGGDANVYLVGKNFAQHWDGLTWKTAYSGTAQTLRAIWGAGPSDVWAAGDSGTIVRFSAGTGTSQPSGTSKNLSAVWGSSATDVWIVGALGTVLHWDGNTLSRVSVGSTDNFLSVAGGAPGEVFLLSATTIYRWDGTTLTTVDSTTSSFSALTTLYGVGGRLWAGTQTGLIVAR